MPKQQTSRRDVIAGLTMALFMPNPTAEADPVHILTSAPAGAGIDVPGLVSTLHEIALHFPEISNRVDDLIGNLGSIVGKDGSPRPVIDLVNVLEEHTGTAISFDWLFFGDGDGPNGQPRQMVIAQAEAPRPNPR